MHWQLTLTWTESDRLKTQTIDSCQHNEMSTAFRIGRDPAQCDLVLTDNTVSRLHVELFFNSSWKRFYLRNLQPKNSPKIDGGLLIAGEVVLHPGSIIELGRVQITVTQISEAHPNISFGVSVSKLPQYSPVKPLQSRVLFSSENYRLECPNCHSLSPLDLRNSACLHCGHFLADAESILIPPSG
jgi:FHA domain